MSEDQAFEAIIDLVRLARNGKPYKQLLPGLKESASKFPRVAAMLQQLAKNLAGD